jgi:hypothetical protein
MLYYPFIFLRGRKTKQKETSASWAQRHAHKFFLLLNELATLKQHFVSRCSTKVETRYNKKKLAYSKDLFVRNADNGSLSSLT